MAALGHNHSAWRRPTEDPLVRILAEMITFALEWEVDSQLDLDQDSSLNQTSTGIDYPPTDPQPAAIPWGLRDEEAATRSAHQEL